MAKVYYTVYETVNNVNGKKYIGVHKTNDPYDLYLGSGTILKDAIKKYGKDKFTKTIIHFSDSLQEMYSMEALLVTESVVNSDKYYNCKVGGTGGLDFINNNPIQKQKQVDASIKANLGVPNPSKARKGKDNGMHGVHRKGKDAYWYGRLHSDTTKKLISSKCKQAYLDGTRKPSGKYKRTDKHRETISNANSKSFTLTNPSGNHIKFTNLAKFARDNNLSEACLRNVIKGRSKEHKGWRI